MTPRTNHHYRLNTGHRAVCLASGAITSMYVLPATGEKIVLLNAPSDPDAIRAVEDVTLQSPEAARFIGSLM